LFTKWRGPVCSRSYSDRPRTRLQR
jgi:hypothetical protein